MYIGTKVQNLKHDEDREEVEFGDGDVLRRSETETVSTSAPWMPKYLIEIHMD